MPPRDPRLCPALEHAHPADSPDPGPADFPLGSREILFGDGEWHLVHVRAAWTDRYGRTVVSCEWHIEADTRSGAYLVDEAKMREV